tara:strand:+ start:84 stop:1193 length:1110 start_codon:yes stop_codon:yes gene_type:complete
MLQNKIYQNYLKETIKTFSVIVLGLALIALTVRAVNFLELIVDNGYPVITYFKYSFLNIFGIAPKFIPLAFFISVIIFIIKHKNDSELIILWTSGVEKIKLVNLILISSLFVVAFYLIMSTILTPSALNKSRQLLSKDNLNSLLPTIRSQNFSDSFKGFTLKVDKKIENEIEGIFLHDTGKNLKNFSSNISDVSSTTIIAREGIVNNRSLLLISGQVISSKKNKKIEIINFDQLNINLKDLATTTIKKPKIQETSTLKLLSCFFENFRNNEICNDESKKEILPNLIRRLILPFYIPAIALICSFLLISNNLHFVQRFSVFSLSFLLLVFTELIIRYTGVNNILRVLYIVLPFTIMIIAYSILSIKFKKN